jgi:hypothetical protein
MTWINAPEQLKVPTIAYSNGLGAAIEKNQACRSYRASKENPACEAG